jgi:hypothetical protein
MSLIKGVIDRRITNPAERGNYGFKYIPAK